ncbi:MAG: enoyl-CoA hydratase-related protein [Candidatus Dechloromonas phosphoritropha]
MDRPEQRNTFRPETVKQLIDAVHHAHHDNAIGVIIMTGAGTEAFCPGGDQTVSGAGLTAPTIGMKRAREIWLSCHQYDAATTLDWGLVNTVVPIDQLEAETTA